MDPASKPFTLLSVHRRTNDLSRDEITALCGENRDAKTFAAGTNEAVIVNSTSVHWVSE
jgi:hypothetical protein